MSTVTDMLNTYPASLGAVDRTALNDSVEECQRCAQACTACADACLAEPDDALPVLRKCVRTCADCADVCDATARVLSRHTGYDVNVSRALLRACATITITCAEECQRHAAVHGHCRVCAEACQRCADACQRLLANLS
ncbi:four-helix bundle copper-binding protein [Actinoalloteichus spitiensis]|uniref:four-helix bundle copper-binding protein n=1 Tax=Actinoalloteichus spitiensis TaxID=252394 RepID=UPI0003624630|nr:four-helix bundle copper-binding protein [Actinoalloteichus spitiensis]